MAKPKDARSGLDLFDFLPTRRAASVAGVPSTLVQRPKRGRGLSGLVDPCVVAKLEQLEAIGDELARSGPLELLQRVHARTNARVARLRDGDT